ncbi:hypothetical protein PENTCL1PPCAC_4190, partial [Pristionchus entomophagus]
AHYLRNVPVFWILRVPARVQGESSSLRSNGEGNLRGDNSYQKCGRVRSSHWRESRVLCLTMIISSYCKI